MNFFKIETETQELHKDSSIIELKVLIFLTIVLKYMHTRVCIYLMSAILPISISLYYFRISGNWSILLISALITFIVGNVIEKIKRTKDDEYTMHEVFLEQECVRRTLVKMLKHKKSFKST
jgi:hypothetical protein